MTTDIAIAFAILAGVVVLFVSGRVPVGLVAIGAAIALWATGLLPLEVALAGFSDPAVIFIASLFVVSEALDATGVTTWAGQQLIDRAGEGRGRLVALTMLLVALLTALISVNGAVAALIPVVVVMAVRTGRSPSQLLLPLVFGAHAGSMLALTGTPVNVIVSEAALNAGEHGFGFFEFTLVGVPLVLAVIAVTVTVGPRVIPERRPRTMPPDLSRHARTLVEAYGLDSDVRPLWIGALSPLVGRSRGEVDLRGAGDLALVGVLAADGTPSRPDQALAAGDALLVRGPLADAESLAARLSLETGAEGHVDLSATLVGRGSGVVEMVIPPRSPLIGEVAFPGMMTAAGEAVILAVQRQGEDAGPREVALRAGDTLLLQGPWDVISQHAADPRVLVVDEPELVRRQAVPLGTGAGRAIAVLAAFVVALATGIVPAVIAGLLAAGSLILLRVLSVDGAYRSISWTTVVLVAGMIPLSTAMTRTGAADLIAEQLVGIVGPLGPYALLAGLFIVTAAFGQLISNMATALIMIPIAVAAATDLGLSVRPVLMSLTVAASAAYLTPVATPVNLMVMSPAGYRFGDYWRLGILLLGVTFVAAVVLVPLIWPF